MFGCLSTGRLCESHPSAFPQSSMCLSQNHPGLTCSGRIKNISLRKANSLGARSRTSLNCKWICLLLETRYTYLQMGLPPIINNFRIWTGSQEIRKCILRKFTESCSKKASVWGFCFCFPFLCFCLFYFILSFAFNLVLLEESIMKDLLFSH